MEITGILLPLASAQSGDESKGEEKRRPASKRTCWGETVSDHVQRKVGRWGSGAMELPSGDLNSQQVTGAACIRYLLNFSSNQQLLGEAWSDTFGEICHIFMCNNDVLISKQREVTG